MEDRELLELAAKAAGVSGKYNGVTNCFYLADEQPNPGGFDRRWWNPLTDDGDALRLANSCELNLVLTTYGAKVSREDGVFAQEYDSHNPQQATRRAIVRAAAEIGRTVDG